MAARHGNAKIFAVACLGWSLCFGSRIAATQTLEFCPEVNGYMSLSKRTRLWVQGDRTREEGSPMQSEIGPSLQVSLKPLLKLHRLTERQPDKFKSRILNLSVGYRYLQSVSKVTENRIIAEASPRFPLVWKILATDRNRGEIRWIDGESFWRYRNRLTLERPVTLVSYEFTPYIRAEGYYDNRYNKWSAASVCVGLILPFQKHFELEPNFQHMNDTGGKANQLVESFGLTLSVYF